VTTSHPYRLITASAAIPGLVEELRGQPVIGIDTETTGLDPYQSRLRLLQLATPAATVIIDCFRLSPEELQPLAPLLAAKTPVKVAHNAKFDGKFLRHHLGVRLDGVFDTYLASQLLSAGSESDRHGLEPVVARYLGRPLDKQAQRSDWSGELSDYQLGYAAADAAILLPLYHELRARLEAADLLVTAELEFDAVRPVIGLELNGVWLDVERWRALIASQRQAHDEVEALLQAELAAGATQINLFGQPEPINLDSPGQVREAFARLGITLEDTREWRLQRLADSHPLIARLLEHRHLSKNLSTFGENILEMINPATGRLHPDYRQIGTPTGRLTSSGPSLQQIPHREEYRSCFRAPAGCRLVVADYSQIEMRILADFARDPALLAAFDRGEDLHRQTAAEMFDLPLEQITHRQREYAKGLNYGLMYGMGADGLASRLEASLTEATSLMERYFKAYAGVARWLDEAGERAVREGRARTASGRLWIFQLDPADPATQAALRRVGKNAPIQGTASDIFKRAMRLLDEALDGLDARIVNAIHDELVIEVAAPLATTVAELVARTMVAGAREFLRRVPVEVDVVVADAWLKGK
jgi:DNA polymerase-1